MRVLILCGTGQLGRSLIETAPAGVTIVANTVDITDCVAIQAVVADVAPDVIFNAAAYTAVDKAENDEERAYQVNAAAVAVLAAAARRAKANFVHISTDFVFDGARGSPYRPDCTPNPLNAYGRTKLAGEMLAGADALIVRTGWLYSNYGQNFVRTMLRLMDSETHLRVVADQIGTPTWSSDLATSLWTLARAGKKGIYHYSASGVASWYDFAVAIQEEALAAGLLERAVPIIAVDSADRPTAARRPSYSVLDKSSTFQVLGEAAPHWRTSLRSMMREVAAHG